MDQGAPVLLRDLQLHTQDEMLFKYISRALVALQTETKSRQVLLDNVLQSTKFSYSNPAFDHFDDFNPYATPVPHSLMDAAALFSNTMASPNSKTMASPTTSSKKSSNNVIISPVKLSPLKLVQQVASPKVPTSPKRMPAMEKVNDAFIMQTSPTKQ